MAIKSWFLLSLICLFCGSAITGQQSTPRWQKKGAVLPVSTQSYSTKLIGVRDGLISSEILSLLQDRKGFVWVGTALGLSRYDGLYFQNFITCGNRPIGKVFGLAEDSLRNVLWIMSDVGLCVYQNGNVHPIGLADEAVEVYDICIANNSYWIATSKGVAHFTGEEIDTAINTKQFHFVIADEWSQLVTATVSVKKIARGTQNSLWLSSRNAIYFYDGKRMHKKLEMPPRNNNKIISILQHPNGRLFFTTNGSGIFLLNESTATAIPSSADLSANLYFYGNSIFYYCSGGIYELEQESLALKPVTSISAEYSDWISVLMIDREKNFWAGTHEGLMLQQKKLIEPYRVPRLDKSDITCVYKTALGTMLWGSTNGIIYTEDIANNSVRILKRIETLAEITAIHIDSRGRHWYSTGTGGIYMEHDGKKLHYTTADGLGADENFFFMEDEKGNVWTGGDSALTRFATGSNDYDIQLKSYRSSVKGNNWFTFINAVEGTGGYTWFAGAQGVFYVKDDSLYHYYFPGDSVVINASDIQKARDNSVWISTKGQGIWHCYFDTSGKLQVNAKLTTTDGLGSNVYVRLLCDSSNIIWALHYAGMSRMEKNSGSYIISNYNNIQGYPAKNYHNAWLIQHDEQSIIISTSSEIAAFNPGNFSNTYTVPVLQPDAVTTKDSSFLVTGSTTLKDKGLQIPASQNNIAFYFSAVYFNDPASLQLRYRLSGKDTSWKSTENSKLISFEQLPAGDYTLEAFAISGSSNKSNIVNIRFTILTPFWKTSGFGWALLLLVAGLSFYWIKHRERNIRRVAQEKEAIKKQITELEIKALKSQMNPHFVFNSLNSIAHLIASNQSEKAFEYLAKFSKLLRMILDETENNFVLLKDEIKMLHLYLQIEALRFGESFVYKIDADAEIEQDETLVPALLIHPLVENAIWHGLLHKNGNRSMHIDFKKSAARALQCSVTDNGIGIEAARNLKENRIPGKIQKSRGLQLVKDRLSMLEDQFKNPCWLILNSVKENGTVDGTVVTIQFPVLYAS